VFIEAHRGRWPVRLMCQVLAVAPGGYYGWRRRPLSPRAQRRETLAVAIKAIHGEVKARYGSPRIHIELAARGEACCVNTVAKLMRRHGIAAKTKRKFRCTTDSNHDRPVAENVVARRFEPEAANEVWTAEIVHSQMTKPAGLAGRPDRERIPDLDVVPGHHDPVDQQLDQLPLPLERRRVETHSHPLGERTGAVQEPCYLPRPARLARERLLLGRQRGVAAFQLRPSSLVLAQCNDPAQVCLGQPLDLLGQARPPAPQVLATGLQLLR
jgi:hypothetical protein